MPWHKSQSGNAGAFTLIELMVVMAIIGITTALIIPEMKGTFQDSLLRSTGRDLVNTFSLASSRAVGLDRPYRVQFDPANGRYLVERLAHHGDQEEFVPVADARDAAGSLDPRITVEISRPDEDSGGNDAAAGPAAENPPDTIGFYPDGTADAAEIKLRDREGFQLVLELNPVTARVRILEPQRQ